VFVWACVCACVCLSVSTGVWNEAAVGCALIWAPWYRYANESYYTYEMRHVNHMRRVISHMRIYSYFSCPLLCLCNSGSLCFCLSVSPSLCVCVGLFMRIFVYAPDIHICTYVLSDARAQTLSLSLSLSRTHTHTHTHTNTQTHLRTPTLSLSHTLYLSLSHTHNHTCTRTLNPLSFPSSVTLFHTHSLTHTHAHTNQLAHTHSTHFQPFLLSPLIWGGYGQ